ASHVGARGENGRARPGEAPWVSWYFCARRPRARSRPASTPIAAASRARVGAPFISIVRTARRPTASRSPKAGSTITRAPYRRSSKPLEPAARRACSLSAHARRRTHSVLIAPASGRSGRSRARALRTRHAAHGPPRPRLGRPRAHRAPEQRQKGFARIFDARTTPDLVVRRRLRPPTRLPRGA